MTPDEMLSEIERLKARCDLIANVCTDTAVAVMANYEVSTITDQVVEAINKALLKIDCPDEAARRARFAQTLYRIEARKVDALTEKLFFMHAALEAALPTLEHLDRRLKTSDPITQQVKAAINLK